MSRTRKDSGVTPHPGAIRQCRYVRCGGVIDPPRPGKRFCSDTCRYRFHNPAKVKALRQRRQAAARA